MTTRRQLLVSVVVTTVGLSGCTESNSQRKPADNESTPDRSITATTTEPETTTNNNTTTSLNETSYPLAQQGASGQYWDGRSATVYLFTNNDWQTTFSESGLTDDSRSLLEATDYESHSIVAVIAAVSNPARRWILESVTGVGTKYLTLKIRENIGKSGVNRAEGRLVLIRLPNQGTQPKQVTAKLDNDKKEPGYDVVVSTNSSETAG